MLSGFNLVETRAKIVLPGQRYGRLTVVAVGQIKDTYRYYAVCWCDCNSGLKRIRSEGLKSGAVVSCGCYQKEISTTHGLHSNMHYSRHRLMMDRCYNDECTSYPNYGGRGISVCPEWHDLATYISQLPDGYFDGAHLDRIDNDGNYEPRNVRWVTPKQNYNNRRSGRMLTLHGATMSATDWSVVTGFPSSVITSRIDNDGWTVERALTTPLMTKKETGQNANRNRWKDHVKKPAPPPMNYRMVEWRGETMRLSELAAKTGIPHKLLAKRIFERGWSVDRAVDKDYPPR